MEALVLNWAADQLKAPAVFRDAVMMEGVSIDSRTVQTGDLFFAIVGEKTDGHLFVLDALASGAVGAVISKPIERASERCISVPDTIAALGDLAAAYRARFDIPVVGITGSVGKTSTKEMISHILNSQYPALYSQKNQNTEIGLPITLFGLNSTYRAAALEMGMRGLGQIARLCEIAHPTVALITMIGYSHLELLGSRENIALAKSEIYQYLDSQGTALLPVDSDFYPFLSSRVPHESAKITFSSQGVPSDVTVTPGPVTEEGFPRFHVRYGLEQAEGVLSVIGRRQAHNAAAALAASYALSIPLGDALTALESWHGAEGRMQLRHGTGRMIVLDDCYNAAVESMCAALQTLETMAPPSKRVAALGDMKELGDYTEEAHQIVGRAAAEANLRLLVTVGEESRIIGETMQGMNKEIEWKSFPSALQAAASLPALLHEDDTVLVKGSRALAMESIVEALTGKNSEGSDD